MQYTHKLAAKLSGLYFFGLLGLQIGLHSFFMTAPNTEFSPTLRSASAAISFEAPLVLEDHPIEFYDLLELADAPEESIVIDHHDITGLKRLVLSKRQRNARREERASRPRFVPAARIRQLPIAYQSLFDSLQHDDIRGNLIHEAKKHLGLRYVWGGSTPKGFDCSGFTAYLLKQQGIGIARSSRYQAHQGTNVDMDKVKTGDLIFFSKYGKGGRVTHVAMVVANKKDGIYIIHSTRRGIVVDNLSESSYWKPKALHAKDMIERG